MKRLPRVLGGIVLGFGLLVAPLAVRAQTQSDTLADLRQQLSVLGQDLVALRQELVATLPQNAPLPAMGGGATLLPSVGDVLTQMDGLEARMQALTARTEELEYRINRIVADGTMRIGDLEFRLTELEGGDPGALAPTPTLGGAAGRVACGKVAGAADMAAFASAEGSCEGCAALAGLGGSAKRAGCGGHFGHLKLYAVAMQHHIATGRNRRRTAHAQAARQRLHRNIIGHQKPLKSNILPDDINHLGRTGGRCRCINGFKDNMGGHGHRQIVQRRKGRKIMTIKIIASG